MTRIVEKSGSPRIALILQARMGSVRLPGKSMMDMAGAPLLGRILERVVRVRRPHSIVVATTTKPEDDVLATLARRYGVKSFRGAENDLVARYHDAAIAEGADLVVRLPADNATPEPEEIDRIIDFHLQSDSVFSTNLATALNNGYPDGIGAEVIDFSALAEVHATATDPHLREHPHLNFFDYYAQRPRHPERYPVGTIPCPPDFARPDLVLDVNTMAQYYFIRELYEYLYPRNPNFHIRDTIAWYDKVWCGPFRHHVQLMGEAMSNKGRVVFFNGELVPEEHARISIYDSALMFGDMVFEMTRSFGKQQFKLRAHLERLYAGLKILRIPLAMTIDEMEAACHQTVEANDHLFGADDEHRLMIDISRGLLGIYEENIALPRGPNVIIADFPLRWTVAGMGGLFDRGINAVITSQRAIPASLLDPKIKNRSRIHYLMANIEASQVAGEDNWALLLDTDGFIAEGTGDNFFIIKDGVLFSPEGRNILRGVSRDYVMQELAPQLGLPVREKNLDPYDVYTADEAFMTGTPFCMLPVTRLNGSPIGDGAVGPRFTQLLDRWSRNVGIDIPAQIKAWNIGGSAAGTAPTPYRF